MPLDTTLAASWRPAANFEPRRNGATPSILLIHYTGMESAGAAIGWLCSPDSRVSCHYLIDETGRITQMVAENMRAWHAGEGQWAGQTDINSASIGIELQNPGHDGGYPDFPEDQMRATEALCRDIIRRHDLLQRRVLAHSDIAPARKADPGEKFDWARLARAGIGHWVGPEPLSGGDSLGAGDEGDGVAALQRQLANYGYGCPQTGHFCETTRAVVTAFQRHFRPARIDGRADRSTQITLERLLA